MDTEQLRQLLINIGSELELDDKLFALYEPLRRQNLVTFKDGLIRKTDKGRKAIINPELIHT